MTSFDDDLNACAGIVERGDPHRFRTVMAAPVQARAVLFPLYAFNVEVSRAPWVTQEPMIAEMRLQWWRDVLEEIQNGGPVRKHEVATPLARVLAPETAAMLDGLVAARRWDVYRDAFEDMAHFDTYIDATSGHLMWAAAATLGAAQEGVVRDAAWAMGLAQFLRAIPGLEAAGRRPLVDGTPEAVRALAARGVRAWRDARTDARQPRSAVPALWPARGALAVLQAAERNPMDVADGRLPDMRASLWLSALMGRW